MRSVLLPGEPQPQLQAVSTGEWQRKRIITYVSGAALAILADVDVLIQTIYHDTALSVVTFDDASGKIACSSGGRVFVYASNGRGQGYLKWILENQFDIPPDDGPVTTLSWGASELLVGSGALALYSFASPTPKLLWHRTLGNPVKLALCCPDMSLAASVGDYDRLVKVWRRISIGSENVQFDFSYLPHPRAVERMQWRERRHPEETIDNVLYTIAADQVFRVWAPVWPHETYVLQLWASVDLRASVPESLGAPGETVARSAFVIDSKVLTLATENAFMSSGSGGEKERETLQTLVEVARRCPEVVVVFDRRGRMSAWGLENVGCKTRKTTNVFNIVHAENSGMEGLEGDGGEVQFHAWAGGKGLVVLAHYFEGRICWLESRLDFLLDPAPRDRRLEVRAVWSGHKGIIDTMTRTADGKSLLTSTEDNEHILWKQDATLGSTQLTRQSTLLPELRGGARWAVVFGDGRYIMTLHEDHVVLWDASTSVATEVERCSFAVAGNVLCLLLLPEATDNLNRYHVVAVSSDMTGIAWEIMIPTPCSETANGINGAVNGAGPHMREFATFDLGPRDGLLMLVPVDPVGWNATLSDNLDVFSREVATSVSKNGLLRSWTVKVFQEESKVRWLATSTVQTNIEDISLAKGSSIRKIAVVDSGRSELTIWDSMAAQLEYRKVFDADDVIRDLDWTSTPQSQSILAVGFPHRVLLMCQLRYDYLNAGPSWAPFREIKIRDMTPHPIGDSIWLSNGGLVIGSGNQIFVYSRKIDDVDETLEALHLSSHKSRLDDIFDIVSELNGPLPVYHPQFLRQSILIGKTALVESILVALYKELRTYHEEIGLDGLLGIPIEKVYAHDESEHHPHLSRRTSKLASYFDAIAEDEADVFDAALAANLCDLLKRVPIPHLTGNDQINLTSIVECVAQTNEHRRSIDENGARYLLFFRQHTLRKNSAKQGPAHSRDLSFREISWAFHSDSQEILVDLVNRNSQGRMLWPQARESGIFMWLRDPEAVKRQWEALARNMYTQTDERNPVDCSLHYIALRKKNVLTGLWRMASWNREQASTMRFLANNFSEPRWRTAALKNAYALLGKHRFEYAAAFFLLADALKDACNVILSHLHDPQLAIALCRVYESPTPGTTTTSSSISAHTPGPVLSWLLSDRLLPLAAQTGDRWLATWAFWLLRQKDMAVRALLEPLDSLLPSPSLSSSSSSSSRSPHLLPTLASGEDLARGPSFLMDDPALVVLYSLVREKTVQARLGAAAIAPGAEWRFVLHTARVLDRMGCDLLALDLVRNWDFLVLVPPQLAPPGTPARRPLIAQPPRSPKMRRRKSSITVVDLPDPRAGAGLASPSSSSLASEVPPTPRTPRTPYAGPPGLEATTTREADAAVARVLVQPPAAVFQEPDMSHFDF